MAQELLRMQNIEKSFPGVKALQNGGKVAILTGVPGMPNLEKRIQGFKDVVAGSKLEILPIQAGDADTQKSVEVISQFTTANSDLDAWWFVGAWPLFADPQAIPELKTFMENGGTTISIDAVYPMLQYVQLDMADLLVGQDFSAMGSQGVEALYKLIKGENVDLGSEKYIDTGFILVDKSNIDEVLANTTPW